MKNKAPIILLGFILSILCTATQAQTVYSLEYDPSSPIKSISLKNASLVIEVYAYEIPRGYYEVKTDDQQSFVLQKDRVLEVVSIKGEEKYNALCSGNPSKNNTIAITCEKRDLLND